MIARLYRLLAIALAGGSARGLAITGPEPPRSIPSGTVAFCSVDVGAEFMHARSGIETEPIARRR